MNCIDAKLSATTDNPQWTLACHFIKLHDECIFFCIRTHRRVRVCRLYNKLRKPPCVTSEFIRNIVWPDYILMRIKSKANFKAANTRSVAQREITNMPLLSL